MTVAVLALLLVSCEAPPDQDLSGFSRRSGLSEGTKLVPSDSFPLASFGLTVAGAGDVNDDGYDDAIVGAYRDGENGLDSGAVYVYLGGGSGINANTETKIVASDGMADDFFGYSVSGAGDVDRDGYDDIIVGAYHDDDNGLWAGSAYIYFGSNSGIDRSSEFKIVASDGVTRDAFGASVSGAGDVNDDGYDDIIVGALGVDDNGSRSGAAYYYAGSSGGIDLGSEIKLTASDGAASDQFGFSVSDAGDVDGDGYADVIVGARYFPDGNGVETGSAYVYLGGSGGVDLDEETKLKAASAVAPNYYGCSVSSAGDLNDDGYDDVIVGANGHNSNAGSAHVYKGGPGGVDRSTEVELTSTDAAPSEQFGTSVSGIGDMDDDGYDDLVVGAPWDDSIGSVSVYLGTANGIVSQSETRITASDATPDAAFGWSVAGIGDSNGDGQDDFITGSPGDGNNWSPDSGSAYAFAGSSSVYYADRDGDGYGDPNSPISSPFAPSGYVSDNTDCNDNNPDIHPGAREVCDKNNVDEDCSGLADDADPNTTNRPTWFEDLDGDGYGSDEIAGKACDQAPLTAAAGGDCNDTDERISPGKEELCNNRLDEDCSGTVDKCNMGCETTTPASGGGTAILSILLVALFQVRRRRD